MRISRCVNGMDLRALQSIDAPARLRLGVNPQYASYMSTAIDGEMMVINKGRQLRQ